MQIIKFKKSLYLLLKMRKIQNKNNNNEKTIPLSRLHKKINTLKKPKFKFNKRELLFKDFIIIIKVIKIGTSLK